MSTTKVALFSLLLALTVSSLPIQEVEEENMDKEVFVGLPEIPNYSKEISSDDGVQQPDETVNKGLPLVAQASKIDIKCTISCGAYWACVFRTGNGCKAPGGCVCESFAF